MYEKGLNMGVSHLHPSEGCDAKINVRKKHKGKAHQIAMWWWSRMKSWANPAPRTVHFSHGIA